MTNQFNLKIQHEVKPMKKMKYAYFLGLALVSLIIYIVILYGFYLPARERYLDINCRFFNDTHSTAEIQCKETVFDSVPDGECIYDSQYNRVIKQRFRWFPILMIVGTSFVVFILINLINLVVFVRTRKIELIGDNTINTPNGR